MTSGYAGRRLLTFVLVVVCVGITVTGAGQTPPASGPPVEPATGGRGGRGGRGQGPDINTVPDFTRREPIKAKRPDVHIVGVQAEEAAAYPESLRTGSPVALERMTTMADGIAVACPGDVPFAAIQEHVDEVVTVSEESM